MSRAKHIWLASYPRSGNTFLRTVLWQCFGLKSASIYPEDLGGNEQLKDLVGHVEGDENNNYQFLAGGLPLFKTHGHPQDTNPAIYVVRDGRAAIASLYRFYNEYISLDQIIEGQFRFGTWAKHIKAWGVWKRPNTVLIRYEDMRDNLDGTLSLLSKALNRKILSKSVPNREEIASLDGKWVREESS